MGCYMSVPDNKVYVTEGKGKGFSYATASCQGWRREQEDAEDCIPYFDENASLFILCDGHGGAEVAKYTVQHLPDFIKNHPLYKQGQYDKALREAFIDFDALLRTEKVANELHQLAFDEDERKTDEEKDGKESKVLELNKEKNVETNNSATASSSTSDTAAATSSSLSSAGPSGSACSSSSYNGSSTIVDDVDADTLRREAKLPLRELLNEYSAISGIDPVKRNSLMAKFNSSPVVRSKKEKNECEPACSASTSSKTNEENPTTSSSNQLEDDEEESEDFGPSTSIGAESIKEAILKQVMEKYFPGAEDDSSDESEFDGEDSSNDDDGDDEGDEECDQSSGKKLLRKKYKRPVDDAIGSSSDDSEDSEDSYTYSLDSDSESEDQNGSESENESDSESSSEEAVEKHKKKYEKKKLMEGSCDKEQASDDNDEKEEVVESRSFDDDEDDDNDDEFKSIYIPPDNKFVQDDTPSRVHRPGFHSGCTVVVALIKDDKLYVASAGDSRCIMISRDGTCFPLSVDHKPEDLVEKKRIYKAGGNVTEGRVNGGLNLSRAFGDFTYKQENLPARDQMITPCPDVRVCNASPDKVEYIFLACDGIWNSMENLEVTRFIKKTVPATSDDLVETCLQIFRKCIAPGTDGDGTGCDNMTCILARFDKPSNELNDIDLKTEQEGSESVVSSSQKRPSNEDSNEAPVKRRCLHL